MIKTPLQPGKEYRLNELAAIIGKTRTTIDRYIEKFGIQTNTTIYMGKAVQVAILTDENIKQIQNLNPELEEEGDQGGVNGDYNHGNNPGGNIEFGRFQQGYNPFKQVETLTEKLHQSELERVELKAKLAGLENELKRADDQIDTLKKTNSTLEKSLQATLLLDGFRQRETTINMVPEVYPGKNAIKQGFLQRVKAVFRL